MASAKNTTNKDVRADLSDHLGQAAGVATSNPFTPLQRPDEDVSMDGAEQRVQSPPTQKH